MNGIKIFNIDSHLNRIRVTLALALPSMESRETAQASGVYMLMIFIVCIKKSLIVVALK